MAQKLFREIILLDATAVFARVVREGGTNLCAIFQFRPPIPCYYTYYVSHKRAGPNNLSALQ